MEGIPEVTEKIVVIDGAETVLFAMFTFPKLMSKQAQVIGIHATVLPHNLFMFSFAIENISLYEPLSVMKDLC